VRGHYGGHPDGGVSRQNSYVQTSWPMSPTATSTGSHQRDRDARTVTVPNGKASSMNLNKLLPGSITRNK